MPTFGFAPEFHPLNQSLNRAVLKIASANSCKVYLVGGYIRDCLLGRYGPQRRPHDFDYTVLGGSAMALGEAIQGELGGVFVPLDLSNDTCRIVFPDGLQIDLAGCVGGGIDTDIRRRDFTINALMWSDEAPDTVIDQVGGIDDLDRGVVRAISETSLTDDPLRLLRAFRFAATLQFEIESSTLQMLRNHASKLTSVAAERVTYELFSIADAERAGPCIKEMANTGLLEVVFPELVACHRIPTNAYHHLGLFDHSVQTFIECENGLKDLAPWAREFMHAPLTNQISRFGAAKLAGLLHDIGKPDTWAVQEDGRHTFIAHDKLGADMCEPLAKRLKWSREVDRYISSLVRWHLRPGSLFHQGLPTERALHRFYRKIAHDVPPLILVALGDFRSTCGPGLLENRDLLENQLVELLNGYNVFVEGTKKIPKLLDGSDVMQLLGISPGPVIGELLEELEEAQGLREVVNRSQAEAFVKNRFEQKYSS